MQNESTNEAKETQKKYLHGFAPFTELNKIRKVSD